jgi:hypothetical protein
MIYKFRKECAYPEMNCEKCISDNQCSKVGRCRFQIYTKFADEICWFCGKTIEYKYFNQIQSLQYGLISYHCDCYDDAQYLPLKPKDPEDLAYNEYWIPAEDWIKEKV